MKQQQEQKQPQPQRQKQNLSGEVGSGIEIGWRAGEPFQGYAFVCASKALDILIVVIDRMTGGRVDWIMETATKVYAECSSLLFSQSANRFYFFSNCQTV
jgi:hypothetical protein